MAAINFPNSPTLNQVHTENGKSFKWDGSSWNVTAYSFGPTESDLQDSILKRAILQDYGFKHNTLGNVSGATTIDFTLGNYVSATATGAVTWTFSNPTPSANACGFMLKLTNGGAYSQSWPSPTVKWPGGAAPVLTTSGTDVIVFVTDDGGTTWRGSASMLDSK